MTEAQAGQVCTPCATGDHDGCTPPCDHAQLHGVDTGHNPPVDEPVPAPDVEQTIGEALAEKIADTHADDTPQD